MSFSLSFRQSRRSVLRLATLALAAAAPLAVVSPRFSLGSDAAPAEPAAMPELTATLHTSRGDIQVELYPEDAPVTVANFVFLAQRGFYDDTTFHRVIADFMIQGGDPTGTGRGGPGYRFENECKPNRTHDAPGVLSMANAGPNTNGSQFFVTHVATPWLDGKHTVFGKVTSGQEVVNAVQQGDTIEGIEIQGETAPLLEAQATRIAEWEAALDRQ